MKKILILGGGGFIGGHLAKRLKKEGNFVRIVDLKKHEYFNENEISEIQKKELPQNGISQNVKSFVFVTQCTYLQRHKIDRNTPIIIIRKGSLKM